MSNTPYKAGLASGAGGAKSPPPQDSSQATEAANWGHRVGQQQRSGKN